MAERFPSNNFVPPKRGAKRLVAIGEAPGSDEAAVGEPFIGASGHMLDGWFDKVGVKRHDLWMTNVLMRNRHRDRGKVLRDRGKAAEPGSV